jgi:hypothetical protein
MAEIAATFDHNYSKSSGKKDKIRLDKFTQKHEWHSGKALRKRELEQLKNIKSRRNNGLHDQNDRIMDHYDHRIYNFKPSHGYNRLPYNIYGSNRQRIKRLARELDYIVDCICNPNERNMYCASGRLYCCSCKGTCYEASSPNTQIPLSPINCPPVQVVSVWKATSNENVEHDAMYFENFPLIDIPCRRL